MQTDRQADMQATITAQPQVPIVGLSWLEACQQTNAKASICDHVHANADLSPSLATSSQTPAVMQVRTFDLCLQVDYAEHRSGPFAGIEICISGYVRRKVQLGQVINQNGGRYNAELNRATCHVLVCEQPLGQKYLYVSSCFAAPHHSSSRSQYQIHLGIAQKWKVAVSRLSLACTGPASSHAVNLLISTLNI